MNRPNWDEYFIRFARLAAERSLDPSSKVGAVIVKDNRIISTGYNGLPSGVIDNKPERYDRPLKYSWIIHAEENAIASAAKNGIACDYSSIYITPFHSCVKCTRQIIQVGIREVIIDEIIDNPRYKEDFEIAKEIFIASNVKVRKFSFDIDKFWI